MLQLVERFPRHYDRAVMVRRHLLKEHQVEGVARRGVQSFHVHAFHRVSHAWHLHIHRFGSSRIMLFAYAAHLG